MSKEKIRHQIIKKSFVILIMLTLVGCGGETKPVVDPTPTTVEPITTEVEPQPRYAILKTEDSEEYRSIFIKKGEDIDIPKKTGYTFHGYQDNQGVTYIDETGKITRDYYGTDTLELLAKYTPDEYSILICKDNQPLEDFNKIICKYDVDMKQDLPIGREIIKNRKTDNAESYVIVGFTNQENQQIIFYDENPVTPKSLEMMINHEEKILPLNIKTTDITYLWSCLDTRIISKDGFLKQELGTEKKVFDEFSIADTIDIEVLKSLGYQNVIMNLEFSIISQNEKVSPRIKILSKEAKKEKELKEKKKEEENILLFDTEEIKLEELKQVGIYSGSISIPIDSISGEFYIYYNSEGILNKTWNCTSITIELQFTK